MFNGFYLVQHMALEHGGRSITGVEYIGYDEREGALRSYFFSSEGPSPFGGVALDYVWEARDDGFSVRTGEDGGIATWEATFANRDTLVGNMEWPGGGYEVTMTRAVARAA